MSDNYILLNFKFLNCCCTSQADNDFKFDLLNLNKKELTKVLIDRFKDLCDSKIWTDKFIDYIIKNKYLSTNNKCYCGNIYIILNHDENIYCYSRDELLTDKNKYTIDNIITNFKNDIIDKYSIDISDDISHTKIDSDINNYLDYDSTFNCEFIEVDIVPNKYKNLSKYIAENNDLKNTTNNTSIKLIRIIDKNYDDKNMLTEICISMDGKYYCFKYNSTYNFYECLLKNESKALYTFMKP